jgi:Tfp pilus assembly protein PilO
MALSLLRGDGARDARHLLKLAAVASALALLLGFGVVRVLDARTALLAAHDRYVKAQAEAASVPKEERDLQRALQVWEEKKKFLWRSAETGVMLKDFEDAARAGGVQLLSVEPGKPVENFYRGHLRAVPVKASFRGTFPGVLAAVAAVERLASPGEVRQFQVKTVQQSEVPGTVEAEVEAVFYSLNPPEVRGKVPGQSGRYDPFFPLVLPAQPAAPEGAGAQAEGGEAAQGAPGGGSAGSPSTGQKPAAPGTAGTGGAPPSGGGEAGPPPADGGTPAAPPAVK